MRAAGTRPGGPAGAGALFLFLFKPFFQGEQRCRGRFFSNFALLIQNRDFLEGILIKTVIVAIFPHIFIIFSGKTKHFHYISTISRSSEIIFS